MNANNADTPIRLGMTLLQVAELLHERGVDLIDYEEGCCNSCLPMVRFNGDETEGFRVVQIAVEIGLWPVDLHRVWTYMYGLEEYPRWRLFFHFPPAEGRFDENELQLLVEGMSYTPVHRTLPLPAVST